jgi:thiamine-phosphate pyrophosphorylase
MPTMKNCPPRGLYAITPPRYRQAQRLLAETEAALLGGACLLQFRDKSGDAAWQLEMADQLKRLCQLHRVPLIINDDIELAARIGASGVHLGQGDASIQDARVALGPDSIIGASCHDRLELAQSAAAAGASYLAFGSMFPSGSKPQAVHCPVPTLRAAQKFGLPLVAIGGITMENGAPLVAAGASYLAVIGALFDAPDVRHAAQQLCGLWQEPHDGTPPSTY